MKSVLEETTNSFNNHARKFATLASVVIVLNKFSSYIILSSHRSHAYNLVFYLNVQSIIFCWMLPILIVLYVEKRRLETLGLTSGKLRIFIYVVLILFSVVLPLILLELDRSIFLQVLEQVLFIAFAEEVLWRGYFQKRLSDWMGSHKGILLSSFVFGLGHIVTIFAIEGYLVPTDSIITLVQTTIGGLIFGYLFYWSRSIWPGALVHLFGNIFLFRIIEVI
jgi:membrane protease YdiL (CAAX protease family)